MFGSVFGNSFTAGTFVNPAWVVATQPMLAQIAAAARELRGEDYWARKYPRPRSAAEWTGTERRELPIVRRKEFT